ncbi:MAG: pimeloyl-ACP methyl ester esterase BioH [Methylovulum sp.]|nr:pimeloyl-ACP methyl ester esterase BioH [Methylovulum sp.]
MTNIHQHTFGAGRPIVMVHGWAMHSGIWRDFAGRLAQQYQVTCLDLPGHGRSEKMTPFTLEQIGDALVNALTDGRYCWLGWSLGASIVLDIARRYPERVDALVLLAGNPRFVQLDASSWPGMKPLVLEQFAAQLAENCPATLVRFLSLQVQGLADTKGLLKQLKAAVAECPAPDAETLHGGLQILKHADLRAALADVNKPVLAVLGGRDGLVPAAVGETMQHILPGMQVHRIAQAAHAPFLSHSPEVVAVISHFIDQSCP